MENVHFTYLEEDGAPAPEEALRGVSLAIREGEHVCILGGNGSGKSTLLQLMNALLVPTKGTVEAFGIDTVHPERATEIRRQAAMVFQHPDDQMVTSIVADDVAFGPENLGVPQPEIERRVNGALEAVGMTACAQADPAQLSGGQKQRVAIAGALAMHPRALLLDEPSAMLDAHGRHAIQRIISQLNEEGITIVHVTHFMDDALRAQRVVVLDRGRIVLDGAPTEVFSEQAHLIRSLGLEPPFTMRLAEALAPCGFALPVTADTEKMARALAPQLKSEPEGARDAEPPALGTSAEPAVVFEDVSFSYADATSARKKTRKRRGSGAARGTSRPNTGAPSPHGGAAHLRGLWHAEQKEVPIALDSVSFTVERGTLTALVGHTGSGKSTAIELACALKVPRSGRVLVRGIDTADLDRRRELRRLVGYVSQLPERQLFAQTVYEDVAFGPRNLDLSEDEVRARVCAALEAVGLSTSDAALNRSPFALSGGQQRSVALAGVLAMRQPILVLDEPMAGLDPRGRATMRRMLRSLKDQGTTLILVTHSMDDAAELADQVVALEDGRVAAHGSPRAVFAPAAHGSSCALPAVGEPSALTFSRALARQGTILTPPPLTLSELAGEVCARAL